MISLIKLSSSWFVKWLVMEELASSYQIFDVQLLNSVAAIISFQLKPSSSNFSAMAVQLCKENHDIAIIVSFWIMCQWCNLHAWVSGTQPQAAWIAGPRFLSPSRGFTSRASRMWSKELFCKQLRVELDAQFLSPWLALWGVCSK